MKKKQKQELKQKKITELEAELGKKQKELVEFHFKLRQGQVKNVHEGREIRKEIAFIKTIITQKRKR